MSGESTSRRPNTGDERDDRGTMARLREAFEGEDLAAIVITFLLVVIALFVGLVFGVARAASAETVSGTTVLPAESGTSVRVSRESVPDTQLSIQGSGAGATSTQPQRVVVLDEDVLFDFDSARLRDSAAQDLQRTVDLIRLSGDRPVEVVGFTDAVSPQSYNLPLSRERAQAVADYLQSLGIDATRLIVDWRGETDPVASNSNPIGRQQNRRVEVRIDDSGLTTTPAQDGVGSSDRTPEGSQLTVSQVRVTPTAAIADVTFRNAGSFPVELADDDIWLIDDRGYTYRFIPTWQNPTISVPAGATLNGALAFPGVVPSGVTTFSIVTNSRDPFDDIAAARRRSNDATPTLVVTGARAVRPTP
jgi:outer membrane protein OmpA-like peptidoglycan-associated protein